MSLPTAILSGVAAAVSLNVMHECTRKTMPDAPRLDLVGMRALAKGVCALGGTPPEHLRAVTMAGDLASNALYYSAVALGGPERALTIGAVMGAAAGVGALALPGPLGLGSSAVNRTPQTQVMAAGMYFAAGLLAALVYRTITKSDEPGEEYLRRVAEAPRQTREVASRPALFEV